MLLIFFGIDGVISPAGAGSESSGDGIGGSPAAIYPAASSTLTNVLSLTVHAACAPWSPYWNPEIVLPAIADGFVRMEPR